MKKIQWVVLATLLMLMHMSCYATLRNLTVKLQGVYDSKITLTPFDGVRFALTLSVVPEEKKMLAKRSFLYPTLCCRVSS